MASRFQDRREFIKIFGAAAAGLAIGAHGITGQTRRRRTCVIIGSGLAGLSAAFRLKNGGWDVTVLEARSRIGGRVFSHSMPENRELICELGAEWVGESHERIQALCKEFEIPLQKHQFEDYLMRNGQVSRPGGWDFSTQAQAAWDKMIAGYEKLTAAQKTRLDRLDWWTHLSDIGFTRDDLLLRDLADSTDFGESIRHVSAYSALAEYAESSEKNEMDYKMTGGNSRLVNEFIKRIGAENIRTGMKVSEVNQRAGTVPEGAAHQNKQSTHRRSRPPSARLRRSGDSRRSSKIPFFTRTVFGKTIIFR